MTLSTRAEIEHGREVEFVYDEAKTQSNPYAHAERVVLAVEGENGTEADPHVVDADELAREAAEAAADEMEDVAGSYTDSSAVVTSVAEEAHENAWKFTRELIADSPVLEAADS